MIHALTADDHGVHFFKGINCTAVQLKKKIGVRINCTAHNSKLAAAAVLPAGGARTSPNLSQSVKVII